MNEQKTQGDRLLGNTTRADRERPPSTADYGGGMIVEYSPDCSCPFCVQYFRFVRAVDGGASAQPEADEPANHETDIENATVRWQAAANYWKQRAERAEARALREAAEAAKDAPLPEFYLVRNDASVIARWLHSRADAQEPQRKDGV